MTDAPACTYDTERGWCTREHLRDCAATNCPGCRPCSEDHCEINGRCHQHVNHAAGTYTCPRCIGLTRRQVRKILDQYALVEVDVETRHLDLGPLLEQAAESGVDSEAFNLVGPAADPGQWAERRRRLVATYDARGWCDYPKHEGIADDDPHHPYAVLGRWDMKLRESYGPQTDLLVSVSRAVDYLSGPLLDKFAHTHEFEAFAHDVTACLTHLETVLSDSREPEKGAPCPTCRADGRRSPRLVKHYATHPGLKPGQRCTRIDCHCGDDHTGHCRTCAGHLDTWHCPIVTEHWWSDADYRTRVDVEYVQHATELPVIELAQRTGITASTLRRWAGRTLLGIVDGESIYGPPRLKARGRNKDGRRLYRVADALAVRDTKARPLDSVAKVGEH